MYRRQMVSNRTVTHPQTTGDGAAAGAFQPLGRQLVFTAKALRAAFEEMLKRSGGSLGPWIVLLAPSGEGRVRLPIPAYLIEHPKRTALFDTCILIDYLRGVVQARVECDRHGDRAISIVTWMEVLAGATEANEEETRGVLGRLGGLALTRAVAGIFKREVLHALVVQDDIQTH